jgi:hypothetical protein
MLEGFIAAIILAVLVSLFSWARGKTTSRGIEGKEQALSKRQIKKVEQIIRQAREAGEKAAEAKRTELGHSGDVGPWTRPWLLIERKSELAPQFTACGREMQAKAGFHVVDGNPVYSYLYLWFDGLPGLGLDKPIQEAAYKAAAEVLNKIDPSLNARVWIELD